jgi:hypothetical protein
MRPVLAAGMGTGFSYTFPLPLTGFSANETGHLPVLPLDGNRMLRGSFCGMGILQKLGAKISVFLFIYPLFILRYLRYPILIN